MLKWRKIPAANGVFRPDSETRVLTCPVWITDPVAIAFHHRGFGVNGQGRQNRKTYRGKSKTRDHASIISLFLRPVPR